MRWLYKTTTLELKSDGFEKAMNEFRRSKRSQS